MLSLVSYLDGLLYPGVNRNWDDAVFRGIVLSKTRPAMTVLDLGAGSGHVPQLNFRGAVAHICGVDPDRRVLKNNYLDEAKVGLAERIPYGGDQFDMVISGNVLEHLPQPDLAFREVYRVLKPGGAFLFKTPNRWHYVAILARLLPTTVHKVFNRFRGRDVEETFPTFYRANSRNQLYELARNTGFSVNSITFFEGRPEYLRISPLSYLVGWIYERLVNNVAFLAAFRVVLIADFRKLQ